MKQSFVFIFVLSSLSLGSPVWADPTLTTPGPLTAEQEQELCGAACNCQLEGSDTASTQTDGSSADSANE